MIDRILRRVGRRVNFTYPDGEGNATGILIDRFVLPDTLSRGAVPYWDVVDLIDLGPEGEQIRIGYYRAKGGKLNWGSQTTITESAATWRRLLAGAVRDKPWFRAVIEGVAADLRG
jgi:hypothetical protein